MSINYIKKNGMLIDDKSLELIRRVREAPRLPQQQEEELLKRAAGKDYSAVDRLSSALTWLVIDTVLNHKGSGQVMYDVIRAGRGGLLLAILEYHEVPNTPFREYAGAVIDRSCMNTVCSGYGDPTVPVKMLKRFREVIATDMTLKAEYGTEPTIEEIGERLKMSVWQIEHTLDWYERYGPILKEMKAEVGP